MTASSKRTSIPTIPRCERTHWRNVSRGLISTLLLLSSALFSISAVADSGHAPPSGYHNHFIQNGAPFPGPGPASEAVIANAIANNRCGIGGEPVLTHVGDPIYDGVGNWYFYINHMCDWGEGPAGTQYQHKFDWWGDDIPPACDQGVNAPECPYDGDEHALETPDQTCTGQNTETNPCNPANGNKSQLEVDFASGAAGGLSFARFYNSKGAYKTDASFAPGWRHSYSRAIDEEPDRKPTVLFSAPANQSSFYATASDACVSGWSDIKDDVWGGSLSTATPTFSGGNICKISAGGTTKAHFPIRNAVGWTGFSGPATFKTVTRPNGAAVRFELIGTDWTNELNPALKLQASGNNWVFTDSNDTQETFDSSGKLTSITYRNGQSETLAYNLSVAQGGDGDSSTLDRVTGPFGHTLNFAYDSNAVLESVTTPDGVIEFDYDSYDNLSTVTYPDLTTRQYVYEIFEFHNHLTGIIDENNDRFATWDYDSAGRAILSEHAGGKEQVQLAYNTDGTTTLTMANGAVRTYTFATEQGQQRLSSLSGDVCSTCAGGNIKARDYDSYGFLSEVTDWNNNVTKVARNARGLVETLTEAFGSPDERATTAVWHASYRLPTQVSSPRNVSDYTYDTNGNVLTVTVSGGGKTRAWTLTYNASGQPLTFDGPRTDVTDVTTLEYYTCTTGNECGQLKKVTNALGHVSNYDSYDSAGRLTQMTGPNGLQTSFVFDTRGRLVTTTETPTVGTARVTSMTYDDAGQLSTQTLPNGTTLTYTYSAAHYLTSVTDNLGNSVSYDYDVMGNLIDEDTFDPLSTLKRSMDYVHDKNYRLDSATDGPITTDMNFDLVGNLTSVVDARNATTQNSYDALNRLDASTDALLGVTDFSYDDHDNLTQVVAANSATTTFAYDQLDNLLSENSPDRGLISYTYDDAGNRLNETDARNVTGTYVYDALNRPTSITYPTTAENVTFTYDDASSEGIGRLRSISDQSGSITFAYNEFGEVVSDQRQIDSVTYTTSYQYDAAGNVLSIGYPSGRSISYTRDALGRVTGVTSDMSATQKTVVSSASYQPFGPPTNIVYGNGVSFSYTQRNDYRTTLIESTGIVDQNYSYDAVGNITAITEAIAGGFDRTFEYDTLDRVTKGSRAPSGGSPTYSAAVLADSPILYWRLGESTGPTAADASGNGNNGTYSGTNSPGQPALITDSDTSTQFNTGAGHIAGPVLTGAAITGLETWIQTDATGTNSFFISLNDGGGGNVRTHIYHHGSGYIYVWRDHANAIISDAPVSAAAPHHIALWYEPGSNTSYLMIDGVTQSGTYAGDLLSATNPELWAAGQRYNGVHYSIYQGKMDEVALYDQAVTATTFSTHYAIGTATSSSTQWTTNDFGYDANGNRLTLDDGTTVTNFDYQASTNKLTSIGGQTVLRDASGNRTADVGGTRTYAYNDANRLSGVLDGGVSTATYVHNALGQRTKKTVGGADVIYLYDLGGNLIAEHDATGAVIRDYIWMNGVPVAQIDAGEVFSYLHVDHLGTPRLATDNSQAVVWRWDSDAFGTSLPNEDPDGNGTGTTVNLRFPGQYFDGETGFHYNYYRTYDPSTGRYVESDPIGLNGGMNTFGYVGANPLIYVDRLGLDSLLFDGSKVTHINDEGNAIRTWPAVSGLPGTDRSNMYAENVGPIPEGEYTVDPDNINRDRFWKYKWGNPIAWGNVRTLIEPKPSTFTNGRDEMYFHGGRDPGSAGCIDLTNNNDPFHDWLERRDGPIDLKVSYPRPTLETLEEDSDE